MIFLVPSVHHTGTKTVFNDILKSVKPQINQHERHRAGTTGRLRIHIDAPFLDDIRFWVDNAHIVVPMRHPRRVAIGWKTRGKALSWLGEQWQWLKEIVAPKKPFYLPLENKDRDQWLFKLNMALGTNFETDWPVIGATDRPLCNLTVEDELQVNSWMKDGFFEQFGYYYDSTRYENSADEGHHAGGWHSCPA